MEYGRVAEAYEKMEKTRKRLELIDILTKLLADTPTEIIEKIVYNCNIFDQVQARKQMKVSTTDK